jgi:hypothetical protein
VNARTDQRFRHRVEATQDCGFDPSRAQRHDFAPLLRREG